MLKEIYFWCYKSNWTGFLSLVGKRCDRNRSQQYFVTLLIFIFSRYVGAERNVISLPPMTTHVNISCPLSSYGPARDSMGSFCSLYMTGTAGGTGERKAEDKSFSRQLWRLVDVEGIEKLTYNLEVYITVPRWRKFKVNAASKVTSVFLLKRKKNGKWKIDKVS